METNLTLEGIRRKNPVHFKVVFNHYYEDLVQFANGYLFDIASSEDVVQEVFLLLWESAKVIHIKKSLKAYLYAMVRNKCLNQLKSLKITDYSNYIDLNTSMKTVASAETMPMDNKNVVYDRALQIIETMPVGMQQIFEMKFLSNYKYKEIADELGISVNTVKTQLKRAKFKINKLVTLIILLLSF